MLAKSIGVPAYRITDILQRQRGLTGGNAVRLAAFFIPQLNLDDLQQVYDLRLAERALLERSRSH